MQARARQAQGAERPALASASAGAPAQRRAGALLALLCLGLTACGERAAAPQAEQLFDLPVAFGDDGAAAVPERWWLAFDDVRLHGYIDRALAGNFDLASAWQRLRAAAATARSQGAARWPQLDAEALAAAQSDDQRGRDRAGDEELRLGLAASFEVDLWGRLDALAEAEARRAAATAADYRTAAISLSAEVARRWYDLLEQRLQAALLERQMATNERILGLLRQRFAAGQLRQADLLRQEQLLEATRAERHRLGGELATARHALALLLGQPPQGWRVADWPDDFPVLPPLPRTGLPAELVERRPDVQAARHTVAATNRELAAAISDRYPRLTLTAELSTTSADSAELFDNWLARIAANLLAPLFDGGARQARVEQRRAEETAAFYAYGQTVLAAFAEVEDTLASEAALDRRLASLHRQLELASQARARLRADFRTGVGSYLDVLTALRDEQEIERRLLTGRRERIANRIALYRALAGGFATPRERTEAPIAEGGPQR